MARFEMKQVEAALDAKAAHLTEKDLARIVESRAAVMKLVQEFPADQLRARRQGELLFALLEAGSASIETRKQAAGALIYLGAPIDLVPDDQEGGYEDDAAVIACAIRRCEEAVRVHCAQHDLDSSDYLE